MIDGLKRETRELRHTINMKTVPSRDLFNDDGPTNLSLQQKFHSVQKPLRSSQPDEAEINGSKSRPRKSRTPMRLQPKVIDGDDRAAQRSNKNR